MSIRISSSTRAGTAGGLLLALALAAGGCWGPSQVTYIDSAREPGGKRLTVSVEEGRVKDSACGEQGVARIETYRSIVDRVIDELTKGMVQSRHAHITCAKARQ